MPRRDARAFLRDIVLACDNILSHTKGCDEERFRTNRLILAATEREFTILGEATVQLLKLDPGMESRITDAARIARFRNILVHAYDLIDLGIMWRAVQENVPTLRDQASKLLTDLGS